MSYTVAIVEDEKLLAERLSGMITKLDTGFEIIALLNSVEKAIEWFSNNPAPDLAMFDIQLGDGLSFEILENIPFELSVIFTTAYDDHALKALKKNAIDYLLKPIKLEELKHALQKFKSRKQALDPSVLSRLLNSMHSEQKHYLERIKTTVGSQIKLIRVNEIAYFFIRNKVVYCMSKNAELIPVNHTLDELETKLNPDEFMRINRQVIIHIDAIGKMIAYTKSRVKIKVQPPSDLDEMTFVTSVERSGAFKRWLEGN